jgi:RNA polymerase-binding transcription factor DksA
LLSQARGHLKAIDHAERRAADGHYGRCERCGQLIPAARLAARPTATLCVQCAAQQR